MVFLFCDYEFLCKLFGVAGALVNNLDNNSHIQIIMI